MAINKSTLDNVDNSNPTSYPNGRARDNDGSGNGTPLIENLLNDKFEFFDKLVRLANITFNGLDDNETNGFQLIDALYSFANKNDVIHDLTQSGGKLVIPIKTGTLLTNEIVLLNATLYKGSHTQLRGSDGIDNTITYLGDFNSGERILMIKTGATTVSLVRDVTYANVAGILDELNYFSTRVRSSSYLATSSLNGLLSSSDFSKLSKFPVNTGYFSGLDIGGESPGNTFTTSGDISSARVTSDGTSFTIVRVVFSNSLLTTNYSVRINIQTLNSDIVDSSGLEYPVYKIISSNTVDILFDESGSGDAQSLRVHLETIKY